MHIRSIKINNLKYELPDPISRNKQKSYMVKVFDTRNLNPETGEPNMIGFMHWMKSNNRGMYQPHEGEIENIQVSPEYRRQGIATNMLKFGQRAADLNQGNSFITDASGKVVQVQPPQKDIILSPEHSPDKSGAGQKWADSVGGYDPVHDYENYAKWRKENPKY